MRTDSEHRSADVHVRELMDDPDERGFCEGHEVFCCKQTLSIGAQTSTSASLEIGRINVDFAITRRCGGSALRSR